MPYDKQYFIAKFSAIPDDQWCEDVLTDRQRHCALGHCGVTHLSDEGVGLTDEAAALEGLLPWTKGESSATGAINDGKHPLYQQETPKARILAALNDLP